MKRTLSWLALLTMVLFIAWPLNAQEAAAPVSPAAAQPLELDPSIADYNPGADYPTIWDIVISSGIFGVAIWFDIFFWALASIPLGILSIVHSARRTARGWPLATKLLVLGGVWVLVLGTSGFILGTIYSLYTIALIGNYQATLALSIVQALYSFNASLLACQAYLLFLLVSLVILHFKHRKVLA